MDYMLLIVIFLGIVVVLQILLMFMLTRKKELVVSNMVVENETVKHEFVESAKKHEKQLDPLLSGVKAEVKNVAKMEEKKEEAKPEQKAEAKAEKKGIAKCMEIVTLPSYVLLALILLAEIFWWRELSMWPQFAVSAVILAAIAFTIFKINKKACKK